VTTIYQKEVKISSRIFLGGKKWATSAGMLVIMSAPMEKLTFINKAPQDARKAAARPSVLKKFRARLVQCPFRYNGPVPPAFLQVKLSLEELAQHQPRSPRYIASLSISHNLST
jgi:hypothetical protein